MKNIYIHNIIVTVLFFISLLGSEAGAMTVQDSSFLLPPVEKAQEYISSYDLVAKEKYSDGMYDDVISLCEKANAIMNKYDLKEENRNIYRKMANAYYKKQDYETSIYYLNEFLLDYTNITSLEKSYALHKLSLAHRFLGDLENAFSYELLNYKIAIELNDTLLIWRSNYQLGSILVFQDDIISSLDYYFKTLELAHSLEEESYLYTSLGALGNSYHNLDSLDLALSYNNQALDLARKINYIKGISYSLYNIGNDYKAYKQYDKALDYHFQALEMRLDLDDKWGEASSYKMISNIYIDLGNIEEAFRYFEKGLFIGNEISAKPILIKMYEIGAELHSLKGNHKLANEFLYQLLDVQEEVKSLNVLRKYKSQKTAFEIGKRDKEITSLKSSQAIQSQKMKTLSYIGVAIFPFIILLLIAYHRLKNANGLLKIKTSLIEKQNIALEESNKELEQFAYVASHDMREPIRTIASFNSLLKRKYATTLGERGLEFVNFIEDASNRLDIMLTDLLDYSRVNTQNNNKSLVNLTDSAFSAAKNLTMKLSGQDVKLNVSNLPDVKVNPIQMERLFQNLIANGVKYNNKKEKIININYENDEKAHIISVNDNGIGIAPEHKDKVFEIFRRLHGTAEYEGSGIGLATCKKIVERHDGEIWLDSKPTEGTTVYFSIPMHRSELIPEVA